MGWDGSNRRQFPRIMYPCLVKLTAGDGAQHDAFLTHTENIGVGGISVIVKKEIPLSASVQVEVDLLDNIEHLSAKGRVIWVVRRRSGETVKPLFYDVGIEFEGLSDKDKIRLDTTIVRFIQKGYKILKPVY